MVIIPEHRLSQRRQGNRLLSPTTGAVSSDFEKYVCILTSTTFLICLLTRQGSGLVATPDAQSSGANGLLGVVGEVGCAEGRDLDKQDPPNIHIKTTGSYKALFFVCIIVLL